MGKKSMKNTHNKHEKKQQIQSLIKNLRPKVYITDSSNFKNLVQHLTGNGTNDSPVSSPPPSLSADHQSPPSRMPFTDHGYQENSFDLSYDSSCYSTSLEGSPDLSVPDSFNWMTEPSLGSENFGFLSDLDSLIMGMDSVLDNYESSGYGMIDQQEVCVYDYDLSSLI